MENVRRIFTLFVLLLAQFGKFWLSEMEYLNHEGIFDTENVNDILLIVKIF